MKVSEMKTIIVSIASVLAITTAAWAVQVQQVPAEKVSLSYKDLVKATRAAIPLSLVNRRVRLNIKPFNRRSDAFFVVKKDMIGFVCKTKAAGFKGGIVEATIIAHEDPGEGEFFTLGNCAAENSATK